MGLQVAQERALAPWVFDPPPEIFITRAYKLMGFGHQPEYTSSTTRQAATSQRCLQLLEPDIGVGRTGGTGALHFLKGQSVLDELQAQWIPSWVHSALGRVIVVDASLLGLLPFQAYIQDGIVSYARINSIMPELEGCEYYIFVPSQDDEPLAYEGYPSRMIVDHGDVVHLTPDPAPPQTVRDVQWAFDHFSHWSRAEFADGYDEPLGDTRVLVLSALENFLLPAIAGESDLALTQRICADLDIDPATASIIRPAEPFERPMYYQHILSDIVFLLDTPLVGSELVVFVDSRPVLQTFSAVRLPQPEIPLGEALARFNLRVEAVEGYRLWLKGGRKRQDSLFARHREKFWVKLEEQEFEYTSTDGSDDSDDGDSDGSDFGHDSSSSTDSDGEASAGPSAEELSRPNLPDCGGEGMGGQRQPPPAGASEQNCGNAVMWNCVLSQDACVPGQHGDTPECAPSSQQFSASSSATTRFATVGARLWLFGAAFFLQIPELLATVDSVPWSEPRGVERCCPAFVRSIDCIVPAAVFIDTGSDAGSDVGLFIGELVTLLEASKDEGFLLVCQFVSEVWDSCCSAGGAGCEPATLSLAETVPCTAFQTFAQELHDLLPSRHPVSLTEWQDWLDCDLQFVQAECKSCPAIWSWLTRFASWYDAPFAPESVHVYTDETAYSSHSQNSAPASWAFNVWALVGTEQAYMGHALGVTEHKHSPFFLGEAGDDSLAGEQLALAWAFSWAIEASRAFPHVPFVFHFDNIAAGYGGFGSFQLPTTAQSSQPTELSRRLAVLRQCAQAVCTVIGRHVPSHSGFAGNELADVLAKFASRHPDSVEITSRPHWPSLVTAHGLAEWAWLAISRPAVVVVVL